MTNALATFSKKTDSELVEPLRQVLKGRRLVYVTKPVGFGVSSVDWGTITDMSGGYVSYGFTDGNEDVVDATLTNSKVPIYWKDYKINRRTYESWKLNGTDIDAASAIAAAYRAAAAEDAAIIDGVANQGTDYDINGLYQGAGALEATSADVATFGNMSTKIALAFQVMDDYGIPVDSLAWNLPLSSVQYQQILSVRNTNGIRELPDILDMLNGGKPYSVGTICAAGTGLLLPTPQSGRPYVDFYLTQDWTTEHGIDSEHPSTGPLTGRVYSAGILRIKQSKAICRLTGL